MYSKVLVKTDPWLPVDSLQLLYQLFDDLGTLPVRHELFSKQEVKDDLKGHYHEKLKISRWQSTIGEASS